MPGVQIMMIWGPDMDGDKTGSCLSGMTGYQICHRILCHVQCGMYYQENERSRNQLHNHPVEGLLQSDSEAEHRIIVFYPPQILVRDSRQLD
jgi:hypothetical protein